MALTPEDWAKMTALPVQMFRWEDWSPRQRDDARWFINETNARLSGLKRRLRRNRAIMEKGLRGRGPMAYLLRLRDGA